MPVCGRDPPSNLGLPKTPFSNPRSLVFFRAQSSAAHRFSTSRCFHFRSFAVTTLSARGRAKGWDLASKPDLKYRYGFPASQTLRRTRAVLGCSLGIRGQMSLIDCAKMLSNETSLAGPEPWFGSVALGES